MFTKIFIILVVSLALFGTNTMGSASVARTAIATAKHYDQRKLLRTAGGDKKNVNAFNDDEIGPEDFAVVPSQHMMSESDEARLLQSQSSGSTVLGLVIYFAIVAVIIVASCACCKCCPWYPHMCCAKDNGGCGTAQTGATASTGAATAQTGAAAATGGVTRTK
jgi:hypothetical protein